MQDYQKMLADLGTDVSEADARDQVLTTVMGVLTPAQVGKVLKELERQREAFDNDQGRKVWYPVKLAACAYFAKVWGARYLAGK